MFEVHETRGSHLVMRNLKHFTKLTGRSMFEELQTTARSLCVALARGTLPVGLGSNVHYMQRIRIMFDIGDKLLSSSSVFKEIEARDPDAASEFWRAVKQNDEPASLEIMRRAGIHYPHTSNPTKHQHWCNQKTYVTNDQALSRHISRTMKQAGKAKAGWAKAADEAAGHHRGIPAWASGRKHPDAAGGAILRNDPVSPEIIIMNNVSYIEEAMVATSVWRTVQIAYDKLYKRIRIITAKRLAAYNKAA